MGYSDLMADKLRKESIAWAISEHAHHGDTDVFPKRREFSILHEMREEVCETLSNVTLQEYKPSDKKNVPVLKPDGSFRISTLMHPLDSIVLLAMLHEYFEEFESRRVPLERNQVFSHRLSHTNGWRVQNHYTEFVNQSCELATRCNYVLRLDISDFYNQIYLHRVQNAYEQLGVPEARTNSIEKLLTGVNQKASKGIPVGPLASRLIAEATMHLVDQHLNTQGIQFVRYVDDFCFFFNTYNQAIKFLQDFQLFLHVEQRLTINPGKTKIVKSSTFLRSRKETPERVDARIRHRSSKEELGRILEELRDEDFEFVEAELFEYCTVSYRRIKPELLEHIASEMAYTGMRKSVAHMFNIGIQPRLDSGLLRYALKSATEYLIPDLLEPVLSNWARLSPVYKNVVEYLAAVISSTSADQITKIQELLQQSPQHNLDYNIRWSMWLLAECAERFDAEFVSKYLRDYKHVDDHVGQLSWALKAGNRSCISAMRESVDSQPPGVKRAVIMYSGILGTAEREPFLKAINCKGDTLESLLVKHMLKRSK